MISQNISVFLWRYVTAQRFLIPCLPSRSDCGPDVACCRFGERQQLASRSEQQRAPAIAPPCCRRGWYVCSPSSVTAVLSATQSFSGVWTSAETCAPLSPAICARTPLNLLRGERQRQTPLVAISRGRRRRVALVGDWLDTIAADGVVPAPVHGAVADQAHQRRRLPARPSTHLQCSRPRWVRKRLQRFFYSIRVFHWTLFLPTTPARVRKSVWINERTPVTLHRENNR